MALRQRKILGMLFALWDGRCCGKEIEASGRKAMVTILERQGLFIRIQYYLDERIG